SGTWAIAGMLQQGPAVVNLFPGQYTLNAGDYAGSQFTVAEDGTVTVDNPSLASGGAGTITFTNVTVSVNPGAYPGMWSFGRAHPTWETGLGSVVLVPGRQVVAAGDYAATLFTVAPDGTVTVDNPSFGTGGAGVLTFASVSVSVSPGSYIGMWSMGRAHP